MKILHPYMVDLACIDVHEKHGSRLSDVCSAMDNELSEFAFSVV